MEDLIQRQSEIVSIISGVKSNFGKDSASRKTAEYLKKRLETIDNLWGEFNSNHTKIFVGEGGVPNHDHEYFKENIYQFAKDLYGGLRNTLSNYNKTETSTQPDGEVDELLRYQRTHFRAFDRTLSRIHLEDMTEKWEIEDKLNTIQNKWKVIEELHIKIDNILRGGDVAYDDEYDHFEKSFDDIKRILNRKLSSKIHLHNSTVQLEIPVFTGNYTQWPTFFDLFNEAIHQNNSLTNAQKLQYLKSRVKGEAERLIQHLHISTENYDTAWEILIHRYNNKNILFSKQIELFLNQSNIQKQTAYELRKLYDTTTECIHAVHNLGVDTSSWDPLLVHLLCKKLDAQTYSDYKESRKSPRQLASLDEFLAFIESKFIALEPISRREREVPTTSTSLSNNAKVPPARNYRHYYQANKNINYQAMTSLIKKCPLCKSEHDLYQCVKFLDMTPETKYNTVEKLRICINCLYNHNTKQCTSTKRCKTCNGYHNTILHEACEHSLAMKPNLSPSSSSAPKQQYKQHQNAYIKPGPSTAFQQPSNQRHVFHVATENRETLLPTAVIQIQAADGTYVTARALLDQAAQASLISENLVQRLGLKRHYPLLPVSVSGIDLCEKKCKGIVQVRGKSAYDDHKFDAEAYVVSKVAYNLPQVSFEPESLAHLQDLPLADPQFNVSQKIDLLLHSDVYSEVIRKGLIKGPPRSPIAQETTLGWIISGSVKTMNCFTVANSKLESNSLSLSTYHEAQTTDNTDLSKFWEVEDISSTSCDLTEDEKYCEELYQQTTERSKDGRYVVALPMKPGYEEYLGPSKAKAVAQFRQLEIKLNKNTEFSESYKQFMSEYIALNHMRPAEPSDKQQHFLPHHGVLKSDSENPEKVKIRVVFNASSKIAKSGKSLNDLMYGGSNLQQDLQALILKWRSYTYVFTADIEKMFRQILIRDVDQHLQMVVWRESPCDLLQEYKLTTLTYGMKISPFLALRTLQMLAKDEAKSFPLAAAAIKSSFYMDDLLSGHNSLEKAKELQSEFIQIFQTAQMNLRKWSSNDPQLLSNLTLDQLNDNFQFKCPESRKTLGLKWEPTTDCFTYQNQITADSDKHVTKRQLLSEISKLFDPQGWLSGLSIRAKLLFQKTWSKDMTWDDIVSEDIQKEWNQLSNDLKEIGDFKISRHIGDTDKQCHLHAFCDASENAYACALYMVTDNKGVITSKLLAAKTRLTPLAKTMSLARKELCGALLLSQFLKKVLESFHDINIKIHAWTDSMIVLGWLNGDISRWKQFVANRVQQINDVIPPSCWGHVNSEENPADCATRGLTKKQLSEHTLWWEGPQWLPSYKSTDTNITYESPGLELKKACVHATLQNNKSSLVNELLMQHSSLTRTAKVLGWVLRFISCVRDKQGASRSETLSSSELNNSYNIIIKECQQQEFKDDLDRIRQQGHVSSKSKIASLNPFIDKQGLLRVGGRLRNANISDSEKYPMILSAHGRLTDLVIHQAHLTTLHGGARLTLSYIRNKFWIISGMRTVKRQLRQCVRCRRFSSENSQNIMGDLPQPRVTPSRPFTHTGVDFTGFVELKINKGRGVKTCKGYIAVFVCLATKAVHLELVSDLSTPTFLAAFRRFCARRSIPRACYSDNGTNFCGGHRLLQKEYREIAHNINAEFFNDIQEYNIEWHFNAPAWPSAGGLWEAAVKGMKNHLKRVLGDQKLTYEEFSTLLHQIEACMNSRPLCQLTEMVEDSTDSYLSPGHFLVGGPLITRPQTVPESVTLSRRWQLVQAMNNSFWKRWSSEYLQQLQTRSKWRSQKKNLEVDDVVIIKEDNLPPGKWALGRVQDTFPGQDGIVRVVSLKTSNNIIKRPVSKLISLPVREEDQNINQQAPTQPNDQASSPSPQNTTPLPQRQRRGVFNVRNIKNFFMIIMLMTIISPSSQNVDQSLYNKTILNSTQGLFFDKVADLYYVKDNWKLVVYYNLSTYWQGMTTIENYVNHLQIISQKQEPHLKGITLQLKQDLNEIEHYNTLLKGQKTRRQKRGFINGIGNIANSLFGVLDSTFAENYKEDIKKIEKNENHLQELLKNQTSIIESEYNILRRHEDIMTKQFQFINERLNNMSIKINRIQFDNENSMYITSSALAASFILSNLRHIQETLIDTITDIYHGHIDTHLLLPEQLEQQMNIISGQLHGNLMLPMDNDITELYKLLKVSARVITDYLIIEVKIPLLSNDVYELDKIISLPQQKDNNTYHIIPIVPYIAYNLKKDVAALMSENDLMTCTYISKNKILCQLDMPLYNIKLKQSLCDIQLVNTAADKACSTTITTCRDQWIRLHGNNQWLFTCCAECHVRIHCPAGMSIEEINNTGIISLNNGCTLMGESYSIYAHNNLQNKINYKPQTVTAPEISMLNKMVNTRLSETDLEPISEPAWNKLKAEIDNAKEQSSGNLSIHDVHHYTTSYIIIGLVLVGGAVAAYRKFKGRALLALPEPACARPQPRARLCDSRVSVSECVQSARSVESVNIGTSPMPIRARFGISE